MFYLLLKPTFFFFPFYSTLNHHTITFSKIQNQYSHKKHDISKVQQKNLFLYYIKFSIKSTIQSRLVCQDMLNSMVINIYLLP